jgi:hypothetical protein
MMTALVGPQLLILGSSMALWTQHMPNKPHIIYFRKCNDTFEEIGRSASLQ